MNIEIIDRKIHIHIWDIIDALSKEDKLNLIDTLSCEDDIIKMVADQLIYGYTEAGSCGGSYCDPSTLSVLDKYKRLLAKSASERVKDEIESLELKVKSLKKNNSQLTTYCWRVYHQFKLRFTPMEILKGKMLQKW